MKTVSIVSQKGGAGKTTLAVHLAVAFEMLGKNAAIIDVDPQGSASDWGENREKDSPEVLLVQSKALKKTLHAARNADVDIVFIDTAPHSESSALEAASLSDVLLIPCRPAIFDIRAIKITNDLAKIAGKEAVVVLNATPARGSLVDEAREGISMLKMKVAPHEIGQRQAFVRSVTESITAMEYEPNGKAAKEVMDLAHWLSNQLKIDLGVGV